MDQFESVENGENILSFKKAQVERTMSYIDDPLEELMNEFAHLEDELEYEDIEETEVLNAFGLDLSMIDTEMQDENQGQILKRLTQQMSVIKDLKKRIQYYLEEIELFAPRINDDIN